MENAKKKIAITALVSIMISIIYEIILKIILKVESDFLVDKIIVDSMILFFISLHFVVGASKLYDFIIKNRYKIAGILLILFTLLQYSGSSNGNWSYFVLEEEKDNTLWGTTRAIRSDEYALETILAVSQQNNNYSYNNDFIRGASTDVFSVVHAPVKDVLSIGKLYNVGYLLFKNPSIGLAFSWNAKLFALILITYELCLIITNKNKKISVTGTIMVAFSGFMQWWSIVDIIIFGELAIVLLDKYLSSEKFSTRILCLLGIAISAISYVFTFYPPYMIAFGYVFLALAIWIIIKNRKCYKISIKDIFAILGGIAFVIFMCLRYYNLSSNTLNMLQNTSYPGERIEKGGNGITYLFSYLYNFLLPFKNLGDNCAQANIISLFPIPMIIAIYYIYKKEKHISFLLPMSMIAVLETVYCISGFPEILSKITLLNFTIVERAAVAVGFANFYILLYMLSNIQEEIFSTKGAIRISIAIMCIIILVPLPEPISSRGYLSLISGLLCMYVFLFLNNQDIRYRKVLLSFLVIFTLIGGLFVNPITKGVNAVTDTDLAKKIQEITNKDNGALWISLDNMMFLSNYSVANGAKTINSTNIYPNQDFFEKVLGKEDAEKQKDIWNRYSHIEVTISDKNFVELIDKDKIKLHLTPQKVNELNIKYIITYCDKNELLDKGLEVEIVYEKEISEPVSINYKEEDGIYIYKVLSN